MSHRLMSNWLISCYLPHHEWLSASWASFVSGNTSPMETKAPTEGTSPTGAGKRWGRGSVCMTETGTLASRHIQRYNDKIPGQWYQVQPNIRGKPHVVYLHCSRSHLSFNAWKKKKVTGGFQRSKKKRSTNPLHYYFLLRKKVATQVCE